MTPMRSPLLRLKNASVTFGALEVLDHINLDVEDGEFVALVGPSGCGKTTLLNLCSGWLTPSTGSVTHRGRTQTMLQQSGLFPWLTVENNLALALDRMAPDRRRSLTAELLDRVGLRDFAGHY